MPGGKRQTARGPQSAAPPDANGTPTPGRVPYPPSPSFMAPSELISSPGRQPYPEVPVPLGREAQLKPGAQVDQYVIEQKIDEGGMGTVYRARQPLIGKCVAIKVIKPMFAMDPTAVDRFVREARAVNEIRHRNIIDIFAFGHLPIGLPYFVMEYLEGHTLQDEIARRGGPFPLDDALDYLRPVFSALEATHAAGIVHRDVKPENIFIVQQSGDEHLIKLLDFGLVKLAGNTGATHRTSVGMPMGTPDYMAPEQIAGRAVDHRADIYSLGIIIYVLLTGRLPFEADSSAEVFEQHRSTEPPPMSFFAAIPRAVEDAVLWALKKDANERPYTVRSLREAIESAAAAAQATDPPPRELAAAAAAIAAKNASGTIDEVASLSSLAPGPLTETVAAEIRGEGKGKRLFWGGAVLLGVGAIVLAMRLGSNAPPPRPVSEPARAAAPVAPPVEPQPGTLRVEAEPADVALTVDGIPVAAATDLKLAPGKHVLHVTKPGYGPVEQSLTLVEGERLVHPVKLQADPPPPEDPAEPGREKRPSTKSRKRKGSGREMRDLNDTARPSWMPSRPE